jgi:hypothetical protein
MIAHSSDVVHSDIEKCVKLSLFSEKNRGIFRETREDRLFSKAQSPANRKTGHAGNGTQGSGRIRINGVSSSP